MNRLRSNSLAAAPWWMLACCGIALAIRPATQSAGHAGIAPPEAVQLFGGKAADVAANWTKGDGSPAAWEVTPEGAMRVKGGDIISKQRFENYQLHVEFKTPNMPNAKGQAKGNSGVFMQGRYEVQVLDSFGLGDKLGKGDCSSIYNTAAPLVNATKPPEQWQAYDITFRAPRFAENGTVTENARVTVILNGIVVQNNTEIPKPTWGNTFGKLSDPGPIVLQDHGNPVEYRNIWIRPLPAKGSDKYEPEG